MPIFDRDIWLKRIKKYTKNRQEWSLYAINNLPHIISWCEQRSINVEFTKTPSGEYLQDDNIINVSITASPEIQMYLLLHECGHYLIKVSSTFRDNNSKFGSVSYVVNRLGEEFDAWGRGRALGERLGIVIGSRFEHYRTRCLNSYVKWASARGYGYVPI